MAAAQSRLVPDDGVEGVYGTRLTLHLTSKSGGPETSGVPMGTNDMDCWDIKKLCLIYGALLWGLVRSE